MISASEKTACCGDVERGILTTFLGDCSVESNKLLVILFDLASENNSGFPEEFCRFLWIEQDLILRKRGNDLFPRLAKVPSVSFDWFYVFNRVCLSAVFNES